MVQNEMEIYEENLPRAIDSLAIKYLEKKEFNGVIPPTTRIVNELKRIKFKNTSRREFYQTSLLIQDCYRHLLGQKTHHSRDLHPVISRAKVNKKE